MMDFEIAPMAASQVAEIAALEKSCFPDPWSESSIASEMGNPLSLWLTAMHGSHVAGYIGSQSVPDEADMMNLAVAPEFRRQGIAEALVTTLETRLRQSGIHALLLEVRASNASAIALYEKLGYKQIGLRKKYYFHPSEDARIYRKELSE